MKKTIFLLLLCVLLTLDESALAIKEYHPGDTFQVKFSVDKNPNRAAAASVRFLYNHKVFQLVNASGSFNGDYGGLINLNGLSQKDSVTATFKVIRGAETGTCKITPRVISSSDIHETPVDGLTLTTHTVKVTRPNPNLPWPTGKKTIRIRVIFSYLKYEEMMNGINDAFQKVGVRVLWEGRGPGDPNAETGRFSRELLRDVIESDFDYEEDYSRCDAILLFPYKNTNYNDLIDEITEHKVPIYVFRSQTRKKIIEEYTALYKKKK